VATFTFFDEFAENMTGNININTDTFKLALTNMAPTADTDHELAITQITAANGYCSGGATLAQRWAETRRRQRGLEIFQR
jgi:hypothetical protein